MQKPRGPPDATRARKDIALQLTQSFQGANVLAGNLSGRNGTRDHRLGIAIVSDDNGAAPALALRAAAILRGDQAAVVPQHLEQRGVGRDVEAANFTVDDQLK
jgi:hypothetical protein